MQYTGPKWPAHLSSGERAVREQKVSNFQLEELDLIVEIRHLRRRLLKYWDERFQLGGEESGGQNSSLAFVRFS